MACPLCDAPTVGSRRCAACRLEAQFGLPEDSLDDERTPCAVEGCPRYGIDSDRCGWHDEEGPI